MSAAIKKFTVFTHSSPQFRKHFMTITLNSLSGKLLISISLRFFPEALSCSFIWNIFLYFSFCLTFCVGFYIVDERTTSLSLKGMASGSRWTFSFSLAPALGQLANLSQQIIFLSPSSWGCAKTCYWPKGENLSTQIQDDWKPDLSKQFKSMQKYVVLRGCKSKPYWPPEPGDLRCSQNGNHKNQGSRQVYKLLSGRYQWAKQGRREAPRWCPWHTILKRNSIGHQMCAKPEACPSGWHSRTSKEASFTERLGLCLCLLPVQCPKGGSLPGTVSPMGIVPWYPGMQGLLATRAR